jgi:phosphomevalonate kinase
MSKISVSAPGKIVLCGEYAVLDGAPAIVTAVDRRAIVSLENIPGPESLVLAPGMSNEEARFRRDVSGVLHWVSGRFRLIDEIFDEFRDVPMPAMSLTLDTGVFRDPESGKKLGLGSSAALTTALAAVLDECFTCKLDVHSIASRSHWAYQSGRGSGADIAASYHGGTIRFEKQSQTQVRQLRWPKGLLYQVLWSGHPASTTRKIVRLQASRVAGKESADTLAAMASKVAATWEEGSVENLLRDLREYVTSLRLFDDSHKIGIFDAGHSALLESAAAHGLVYKPCGAGGGDVGVAFGTDERELDAFCRNALREGFTLLDVTIGANGILPPKRQAK